MDQAAKLRDLMQRHTAYERKNENKGPRIISIASGKGGVGKTNFTVNLAIALQQKDRNVLILDADLGLADVDVLLGLKPKYNFSHLINDHYPIEEIILRGPGGIGVIPGFTGLSQIAELTVHEKDFILSQFAKLKEIDYVLIDNGAGLSKEIISFIAFADEVILITTPEPTAIADVYSLIKVIVNFQLQHELNIVVNKCRGLQQGKEAFHKLNSAAEYFLMKPLKLLGYVVEDASVSNAVMAQEPFYLFYPKSPAARCIDHIASDFIGGEAEGKTGIGFQSFLNKTLSLFGMRR